MLKMTFLSPLQISIHALREEGDSPAFCGEGSALVFLSTPSARRATCVRAGEIQLLFEFLSTPSARRATAVAVSRQLLTEHFYPRPPRGGRLPIPAQLASGNQISIHALREEGDMMFSQTLPSRTHFYPRPPRGGRRACICRHASGL